MIGTVVAERFRIERELGVGSMGVVYEAVRTKAGDAPPIALKFLRADLGDELAARFVREGKALAMFAHPNIVRFIEAGIAQVTTADGDVPQQYLATELVRGVTLRQVMEGGPMDANRALAIGRQMLAALAQVHELGVVHRDVKPENIMLVDGGSPDGDQDLIKIIDFGVAKLASDTAAVLEEMKLTRTGFETFGTALYMPPEVALGRTVDARSDLYAVGAILFEMMAGRPVFDDQDIIVLMRKHASTSAPTLGAVAPHLNVTPELELLLAEALAKDPARRFKSAAEMTTALDAAVRSLEPMPVATVEPTLREPLPRDATLQFVPPAIRAQTSPMPPRAPITTPLGSPIQPKPPAIATSAQSTSNAKRSGGPVADLVARLTPATKRNALIAGGVFLVVVLLASAFAGGDGNPSTTAASVREGAAPAAAANASTELARKGNDLVAAGNVTAAVEHLEAGLARATSDAEAHLALGHARTKLGQRSAALASYERAVKLSKSLGGDGKLHANLASFLDGKDAIAGVIALELAVATARRDLVVAQASKGKLLEVRQRAVAIAEREGFADEIDRLESWSLDLVQLSGCEAKRAIVAKLRGTDRRAIPTLRRAKSLKCIERDVTDAITSLETSSP